MKEARSVSSSHRQKTSSNWSTTSRRPSCGWFTSTCSAASPSSAGPLPNSATGTSAAAASTLAHSRSGCAPGLTVSRSHPSTGSPAASTDDFPDPDAPTTATTRCRSSRSTIFDTSLSRPKNRPASPG
ncbi:hypothetical protein YIM_29990 [Amycolatopsis sp. YIM 10]|nr:hypothetical protein YIM_29990 [Amycolatopsis sp. YIM 10]